MKELTGKEIRGYRLTEHLGAGGFGTVYLAYQPAIEREVAIKVILPRYANQPDFIRRFEAEAQLIARLEHFHIVTLYDYWREPQGAFLVMRFLRGGSLRTLMEKQLLPMKIISRVTEQIGSGLAVAHQKGVVHRDLKPDNILLDEHENAYLADFGIAKWTDKATSDTDPEAIVLGSPAYLPPEYVQQGDVTPQSDIYSFGIMLYEMLTGSLPFEDENIGTLLVKQMTESVPSLMHKRPDLPESFDMVIQRATAKVSEDRYPAIRDMVLDIRAALREVEEENGHTRIVDADDSHVYRTTDIMRQQPPRSAISDAITILNPYKGLRAFEEADAADYFGRDGLIDQLLMRMNQNTEESRFLAVVGPSGSGKSSAVKAGLIPRLRETSDAGQWFIVEMTPGYQPLEELEATLLKVATKPINNMLLQLQVDEFSLSRVLKRVLPDNRTELLLVIDQFEELFTQVEDEAARRHFLVNLLNAVLASDSRLHLIVTLRADFYDRPLLYPRFGSLMRERTEVVLPLSSEELYDAIVGPAQRVGLALEHGLVSAIIQDVGTQSGALPLLQYALTELFERREGNVLTLAAYHESGGVLGALARRADEIYEGLNDEAQHTAHQMFLRLVALGEGTEDTRRRVFRSELTSLGNQRDVMEEVLDLYGKYRLLTFDYDPATRYPTVEVAHESLIRQWERLREWLEANHEDLRMQRRLGQAAAEWRNSGYDNSYLASGTRLVQFDEFQQRAEIQLNQIELDYLQASLNRRIEEEEAERERQAREEALEKRSRQRMQMLVAVMAFATVIALLLTGIAFNQSQIAQSEADQNATAQNIAQNEANLNATAQAVAQDERVIAERNADEAFSLALAAGVQLALRDHDSDLAILLALEANRISDPPAQVQRALAEAAYSPGTSQVLEGHEGTVTSVSFNKDGSLALSSSADNQLILWDAAKGTILQRYRGHQDPALAAAFLPDGTRILSASADYSMRLWDVATAETLLTFGGHSDSVLALSISPNGRQAVSASADGALIHWDLETGRPLNRYTGHNGDVNTVAFSPNGRRIISGGDDGLIYLWDPNTASRDEARILRFFGHNGPVLSIDFSPDGRRVISGAADNLLILWDASTGRVIRQFEGHADAVNAVKFGPDGKTILSGSRDGTVILWDATTGAAIEHFVGHSGAVTSVAFSSDGQTAISGSVDTQVRIWALQSPAQLMALEGHNDAVLSVSLSPDGTKALSGSADTNAIVWDMETGTQLFKLTLHSDWVRTTAINANGSLGLTGGDDAYVRLWNLNNGAMRWQFRGHTGRVRAVAFSPDSAYFASGGDDGSLILWNLSNFEEAKRFGDILDNTTQGTVIRAHRGPVRAIAYSPDGTRILSGGVDQTVRLWDVASGEQIALLEGHNDWLWSVAFNSDGTRALSSSADGMIILWNLETGEELQRFVGHVGPVYQVNFSHNDQFALSASGDGTLRIWDIASGEEIRRYPGHTNGVQSAVFSTDGKTILSAGGDATVREWLVDYELSNLITWTRTNRYVRKFTCEERAFYLIRPLCNEVRNRPGGF